ncbi:hypothetical protein ACFZDK_48970 [Streptomyces sp. NPDC007901]|uniref:hypothetical protein n=1 Tax=Streptomyces sp. NPDC007901 TaxID=3364785 RepID=UPI0036E71521
MAVGTGTDQGGSEMNGLGPAGQAQAEIGAYVRLSPDLAHCESGGRDCITLPSRWAETLTAPRTRQEVHDLLTGEWSDRAVRFCSATSFGLQGAKLDTAIREQIDRLAKLKIAIVPCRWSLICRRTSLPLSMTFSAVPAGGPSVPVAEQGRRAGLTMTLRHT